MSLAKECYSMKLDLLTNATVVDDAIRLEAETSEDNREKLQAMELFKDTHLVKLELLSNATTIDNALNYIRNRQQRKQQEENIKIDTITTSTTRNQVF
ncbi:MAG: hypothetical protein ACJ72R_00080 [Nitrososphaeraceae archaeon]